MDDNYKLGIELELKTGTLEKQLKGVQGTVNSMGKKGGLSQTTKETQQTTAALEGLKGQLQNIKSLNFSGVLVGIGSQLKPLKESLKGFKNTLSTLHSSTKENVTSMLGDGIKGLFPFTEAGKIFREGGATFKDVLDSCKISFKEAGSSIKGNLKLLPKNLETDFKALGGAIKNAMSSAALGIGAIVAQVIAWAAAIKMAINQAKEIDKLTKTAHKLGMSAQEYGAWSFAMERSGIETERMVEFVKALAMRQGEAISGAEEGQKAFKRLGFSMEEVSSMGQAELFNEVVKRLQNIDDETQRNSIAFKIFGENAIQLNNILNLSNAETESLMNNYRLLGGVMTNELTTGSEKLQDQFTNMKIASNGVKNAITEALLPTLIEVARWITKLIAKIGIFLRVLFGIDLSAKFGNSKPKKGVDNLTGSLKGATAAAKELKRWTAGFDELNIIPGQDKGSGSGSGGFSGGGGFDVPALEIPTVEDLGLGEFEEKMNRYKEVIRAWVPVGLIAIGLIGAIICGCAANLPGVLAFAGLAGLGISIGSLDGGLFDIIGTWISNFGEDVKKWWQGSLVRRFFTAEFWHEAHATVKAAWDEFWAGEKQIWQEEWAGVKNFWNAHIAFIFTKEWWSEKWNKVKESCSEKMDEIKTKISEKWDIVKSWCKENILKYFTRDWWRTKFDTIKTAAGEKLDEVKSTISAKWQTVSSWFVSNVGSKFTKEHWKNKFNSIKDGAKEAFNGVMSVVENAVNRIIDKINTLSWDIPDWVPKVGGQKFGFDIKRISIPRLATGGIATKSTLANVGEAGREAILPLDRNTEWMDALAAKIAGPSKIVLMVDGKELGQASINGINAITRQTGSLQLQLV